MAVADTREAKDEDVSMLKILVEFTGGLELLFSNVQKHNISIPSTTTVSNSTAKSSPSAPTTVKQLIQYLVDNNMRDPRREMFVLEDEKGELSIRPGILVLINDADWELEGEDKYELKDGDEVLFVSTLHGG